MKKEIDAENKGLMYSSIWVDGKEATIMFDTRVSHNYIDVQEAKD